MSKARKKLCGKAALAYRAWSRALRDLPDASAYATASSREYYESFWQAARHVRATRDALYEANPLMEARGANLRLSDHIAIGYIQQLLLWDSGDMTVILPLPQIAGDKVRRFDLSSNITPPSWAMNHAVDMCSFLSGLEELICKNAESLSEVTRLNASLRKLAIERCGIQKLAELPAGLRYLSLRGNAKLRSLPALPRSLRRIDIAGATDLLRDEATQERLKEFEMRHADRPDAVMRD